VPHNTVLAGVIWLLRDNEMLAGSFYWMGEELTIKSSRSAGELKLSEPKPPGLSHPVEYIRVSLQDHEIAASSARIYIYEPFALAAYFEELASAWKGWAGKKEWSSVEGDFSLSCTSDGLGHVAMRVTLKSGLYDDDWCVQAVIFVDGGQLEELAVKTKAFLHAERAS
jgi:hypothetical protein